MSSLHLCVDTPARTRTPKTTSPPPAATGLTTLAVLYTVQGQYAKAEPLYQRALAIHEKALGAEHLDIATDLANLAALYTAKDEDVQAASPYQRALMMRENALGPTHPAVARSLENSAALLRKTPLC